MFNWIAENGLTILSVAFGLGGLVVKEIKQGQRIDKQVDKSVAEYLDSKIYANKQKEQEVKDEK